MTAPREYTRWERFTNWLHYHKLALMVAAVVAWVVVGMILNLIQMHQNQADYTFAYVGRQELPQDCVSALETGLASLADDRNRDGKVVVQVRQYVTTNSENPENQMYGYANQVQLLADITNGESLYFLLDDPQLFQLNYQILAHLDGSIPHEEDYEGLDKVIPWVDCPQLTALELGSYTDTYMDITQQGQCQELMQPLYLGRRFFYDPVSGAQPLAPDEYWQRLTEGVNS